MFPGKVRPGLPVSVVKKALLRLSFFLVFQYLKILKISRTTKQKIHILRAFQRFFPSFLVRLFTLRYTANHCHQIVPTRLECIGVRVKNGQLEGARFQFHVVDHKAAAFHVQYLHAGATAVDEDVHVTILYIASHQVGHHSAQGVKTAAHVGWLRIQVILHCRCEAEHITRVLRPTEVPGLRCLTVLPVLR